MPRPTKAKSAPKDSAENFGFGVGAYSSVGANRPRRSNPAPRRLAVMKALRDIEADIAP